MKGVNNNDQAMIYKGRRLLTPESQLKGYRRLSPKSQIQMDQLLDQLDPLPPEVRSSAHPAVPSYQEEDV